METASSTTSSTTLTTKNTDPLLLNMYNNGHKVVAYPGIVAAKSNEAAVGAPSAGSIASLLLSPTSKREKPRAVSAGRVRRPSGRDLVLDIYERLGVERPETSSPTNNNTTATAANANNANPRGRSPGLRTAAEQKRARSLSRGRVRNRWPPVQHAEPVRDDPASPPPPTNNSSVFLDEPPLSPRQQRGYKVRAAAVYRNGGRDEPSPNKNYNNSNTSMPTKDLMLNTSKSLTDWRRTLEKELTTTTPSTRSNNVPRSIQTNSEDPCDSWKDEKKESTTAEDQDEEDCVSPASVKERMIAFGGDSSKSSSKASATSHLRRSVDKQYAAQFAMREHPPKIDIYESARQQNSSTNHAEDGGEEEQKKPAAVGAALEDEHSYHHGSRQQHAVESSAAVSVKSSPSPHNLVSTNSNSNTNNKGKIAEAFLAAIHTQTSSTSLSPNRHPQIHKRSHSFAPVDEVVSTEDHGSVSENVSLLSTNSEDNPHHQLSPPPRGSAKKSWNRVSAYTNSPAAAAAGGNYHTTMSSLPIPPYAGASSQQQRTAAAAPPPATINTINEQHVERLVEERVRARVGDLERTMTDQLQTFMTRLDERMESRVARLERTVHALLATRDQPPQQQSKR